MGLWIVLGAVLVSRFSGMVDTAILSFLTPEIAIYFVIFFILGFFIYAIPYAFIGAAVNTDQEAQQFASVLSVLIIVPYILGIIGHPEPELHPDHGRLAVPALHSHPDVHAHHDRACRPCGRSSPRSDCAS